MDFQNSIFVALLLLTLVITNVLAHCSTCEQPQEISGEQKQSSQLQTNRNCLDSHLRRHRLLSTLCREDFPGLTTRERWVLCRENIRCRGYGWAEFPLTGFVAMVATIATLLFETSSAAYQVRAAATKVVGGVEDREMEGGVVHGHVHGSMLENDDDEVRRYRIVSKVLELGIIVHSVIIGLSLGASKSPKTIKPLIVALSFHQMFEGLGLGGNIFQAKIKSMATMVMGACFTLTAPGGIVIGILVSNAYEENSPKALIVQGVLDAAAAGILIYMALVDLLSPDFKNPRMQNNKILLLGSYVSLFLGAGLMSLLAKWV
ncbi:hypothetical protein SSX86_016780 [Deinandra increscens subsp. villosa]|uniref:Uncharacterized protein n=1 Tax=Deinandra increscens subsp. villosa TaxID=3103831 RepID=A0AAP0GYQ0_9ASTR